MRHDRLPGGGPPDVALPRPLARAPPDRGARDPPGDVQALLRRARALPRAARPGRDDEQPGDAGRAPRPDRAASCHRARWWAGPVTSLHAGHLEGSDFLQQDAIRAAVRETYATVRPTDPPRSPPLLLPL